MSICTANLNPLFLAMCKNLGPESYNFDCICFKNGKTKISANRRIELSTHPYVDSYSAWRSPCFPKHGKTIDRDKVLSRSPHLPKVGEKVEKKYPKFDLNFHKTFYLSKKNDFGFDF